MGRHRAETSDTHLRRVQVPGRRSRRRWPVAALTAVVVVVGGWFGWGWLHARIAETPAASVVSCPAGDETIQVVVAPSIADAIGRAAAAFTESRPVVTDHCVRINVSAVDPQTVLTALRNGWNTAQLGPRPQAWIADSTLWTNRLAAVSPGTLGDSPQSLATSPVVLAMPPDAAKAVTSTLPPTFAELPALIAKANGWADYNEPAWGQFTLALPDPAANPASTMAVTAMLDPATPQGQPPVTAALLGSGQVRQNLDNLAVGQPGGSTQQALVTLGKSDGIQGAPFSAVPVLEVDLYERNLGGDGTAKPANILDEVRLTGPTPFADFPYTPLAGNGLTSDQVAAAQGFRDFLRTPAEQTQLARAGLRVSGDTLTHPDPSPGMDWGSASQGPTPTDVTSYQQLVAAWAAASQPGK